MDARRQRLHEGQVSSHPSHHGASPAGLRVRTPSRRSARRGESFITGRDAAWRGASLSVSPADRAGDSPCTLTTISIHVCPFRPSKPPSRTPPNRSSLSLVVSLTALTCCGGFDSAVREAAAGESSGRVIGVEKHSRVLSRGCAVAQKCTRRARASLTRCFDVAATAIPNRAATSWSSTNGDLGLDQFNARDLAR